MNINLENIEDVIEQLKLADDAYFNTDSAIMSDAEYDILHRTAYHLDKTNPYFIKVGSDVRGGKIDLPYQMNGLSQIYEGEIIPFYVDKYQLQDNDIVISDKLDGVSCMIIYADKDGDGDAEFAIAYSRGNSIQGADISRSVKQISFPKKIPGMKYLAIRGELEMKEQTFQTKYKDKYSTARAMVAGQINKSDADPAYLADIDFIAYSVISENLDKVQSFALLRNSGFNIPFIEIVKGKQLNDTLLSRMVTAYKNNSPYELDGIVLTDNKTGASIKYKVLDQNSVVQTKVKKVHWEISKWGALKPRLELYPVKLFGTTVTFATAFNAKFINDNKLGPGSVIKITKSGSVIPYVLEVIQHSISGEPEMPNELFTWSKSGVEIVVPNMNDHPQVIFKQVLDFCETIEIDLLKEGSLKTLFESLDLDGKSYDYIISTIFDLTSHEWQNIIGANGIKIHDSICRRLNAMKLERLLGGLKYFGFGFGVRKARKMLEQLQIAGDNVNKLYSLTVTDIEALDGFGETSDNIINGMPEFEAFMNKNQAYITFDKIDKTDELKDLSFVFTGFRDSDLEAKVMKMGGKMQTGVSKKTSALISADGDSGSGKCKKANELNVLILTVDQFKTKYNL